MNFTKLHKNDPWVAPFQSCSKISIPCRQTGVTMRKSHTTITRHQEDKQSKATSSLFPIKMIAKLEWRQSNAQQNIERLQNPTMGVTIYN